MSHTHQYRTRHPQTRMFVLLDEYHNVLATAKTRRELEAYRQDQTDQGLHTSGWSITLQKFRPHPDIHGRDRKTIRRRRETIEL